MFQSPFVSAFSIGSYEVKMYGVVMFFAILGGVFASDYFAKRYFINVDRDALFDFFPFMIISGIIFARLYYVILNFDYYILNPIEIPAIWHGGISIHGAILGGVFAGVVYFKSKKIQILPYADVISLGLVLAQAIGRWGNFFNSEAFGTPCNLPWKLYIAPQYRPLEYYSFDYFHPTFLYESLWCIFAFFILFFVVRRLKNYSSGMIFYSYLILYSVGRFLIEGIRTDSVLNICSIPIAQIVSFVVFLIGIFGVLFCLKKHPLS